MHLHIQHLPFAYKTCVSWSLNKQHADTVHIFRVRQTQQNNLSLMIVGLEEQDCLRLVFTGLRLLNFPATSAICYRCCCWCYDVYTASIDPEVCLVWLSGACSVSPLLFTPLTVFSVWHCMTCKQLTMFFTLMNLPGSLSSRTSSIKIWID